MSNNEIRSIEYKNKPSVQYRTRNFTKTNIQSYINNISVPKSLDELMYFIEYHGMFNVEEILVESYTEWTAPAWTKYGDIVFFMHTKTANSTLTALRTELNKNKNYYHVDDYNIMLEWVNRGLLLHKKYGGKIFAIAKVCGLPKVLDSEEDNIYHWKSRIYAAMDEICVLENPIDISEFNHQILVSRQSGITPIFGEDFLLLKELINSKNKTPLYFNEAISSPLPLGKINKDNWILLSNEFRRSFMLETQFRTFYVNYLLMCISDIKKIYRECRCIKKEINDSFIDNVILINGKYLPVEVKLSVKCEKNIANQLSKYCYNDKIYLSKDKEVAKDKVINGKVLVIDTEKIYIYEFQNNNLKDILDLNYLNAENLSGLKNIIVKYIF